MNRSCFLLLLLMTSIGLAAQTDSTFRVMSFNIRLRTDQDGDNIWDNRRTLVTNTIRFHQADLIGVQEAFRRQLDDMLEDMPEYAWFGHCRTDGSTKPDPDNEFSAILYRQDRFALLQGGTYWLSQAPAEKGSVGWDAALPRIVTWVKLYDRKTGQEFFHFNTHFDHIGVVARDESASLMVRHLETIAPQGRIIITGDFNSSPEDTPYQTITSPANPIQVYDAMSVSRLPHYGASGTFAGDFRITGLRPGRIDYIFVSNGIDVMRHGILSTSHDGRLASDHLPVLAEILLIP